MNRRVIILVSLLLLFAIGSVPVWLNSHWLALGQTDSRAEAIERLRRPYTQLDEKARAVKGADEQAIRDLTDTVASLIIGANVPSILISPFKEQAVRAEIRYRSGQKAGIPEANIVRLIAELARKFDAPEHALTDTDEVHEMRLDISHLAPHFIAQQSLSAEEQSKADVRYTIAPLMSPLEAVYVTYYLIKQKEINPSTLLTPSERMEIKTAIKKLEDKGYHLTPTEQWIVSMKLTDQKLNPDEPRLTPEELATEAQQQTAERQKSGRNSFLTARSISPREKEIRAAFRRAYQLDISDALALTKSSLELLGIED